MRWTASRRARAQRSISEAEETEAISAESARKAVLRAQDRERLKLAASAPKAIEEALRAQRERLKRRKRVKAVCPNPYRRAGNLHVSCLHHLPH